MKKSKRIFIFMCGIILLLCSCSDDSSPTQQGTESIEIGVLLPITGSGPIQGDVILSAITIARDEFNDELSSSGSEINIELNTIDTQYDLDNYISGLQELSREGIKFIITSTTSAMLSILKSYADTMDVILIEQGSTSPSLAESDHIFRMIPDDNMLAEIISNIYIDEGIEHLVILFRNDIWGADLANLIETHFVNVGGHINDKIAYSALKPQNELPAAISQLNDQVAQAIGTYGADKVAVEFISFEEGIDFFKEAAKYTDLGLVKWYGSDGITLNNDLPYDTTASQFAQKVRFASPLFAEYNSDKYNSVKAAVEADINKPAISLALVAYDALWIAAKTITENPNADKNSLKSKLLDVVSEYEGITGPINFNASEDRTDANYDFWGIELTGDDYYWIKLF